jgi:hypothetical protein
MRPAQIRAVTGQKFRTASELMTDMVAVTGAVAWDRDILTTVRYSYFRYRETGLPVSHSVGQPRIRWLPHKHRTYRETSPWAAVSRTVVAPKARAARPAPLPFDSWECR